MFVRTVDRRIQKVWNFEMLDRASRLVCVDHEEERLAGDKLQNNNNKNLKSQISSSNQSGESTQPNRPFHNLKASKSVERRVFCS